MQAQGGKLWFSPSDLSEYLGCLHATHLSLAEAMGTRPKSYTTNAYRDLIFRKGNEHEAAYLAELRDRGLRVETVGWSKHDLLAQAERTAELMREGADVIYQGVFVVGAVARARGLRRARRARTVARSVGLRGRRHEARAQRGSCRPTRCSCASTARASQRGAGRRRRGRAPRARLGPARVDPPARDGSVLPARAGRHSRRRRGGRADRAVPVRALPVLRIPRECEERWATEDHLTRVAGMRRDQIGRLRDGGRRDADGRSRRCRRRTSIADIRAPTLAGADTAGAAPGRRPRRRSAPPYELLAAGARPRLRAPARAVAGRCHVRPRGRSVLDAGARS